MAVTSFGEELNQRRGWILANVSAVSPIVDSYMAGHQVRRTQLVLVLSNVGIDLAHLGHFVSDDLWIPLLVESILFLLARCSFNVLGERDEVRIR